MFFIFGSSGFIGKRLKERLIKQFGNNLVDYVGKKYKNKIVDLSKNNIFKELPIRPYNNVYILAAKSNFIFNNKKEERSQIHENIAIVKNIIEFCKICKVRRVFFISSSSVYSNKNLSPFHEKQKIKPNNSLGTSKYSSEKILKKAFHKLKTKVVILRVPAILGKGANDNFLINTIKQLKKNQEIIIHDRFKYNNFVHVKDLSSLILKILTFCNFKKNKKSNFFDIVNCLSTNHIHISKKIKMIKKN